MRARFVSVPLNISLVLAVLVTLLPIAFLSLMDAIRAPLWEGYLLSLAGMMLSGLAVWAAVNHFVLRWVRRAGRRTKLLAEGDYRTCRDAFQGAPQELQQLARNLNEMAAAIAERDRALRSALADKDAMAREVNHRIRNNLQMISSLINLQATRLADPYARRLMHQTCLRVSALGLVHRLIYELDGSERGLVDTDRLFHELCLQLEASAQPTNVSVSCHSSIGTITGDQAVSTALIIVEAVSNAYRHGFPKARSGHIDVRLFCENDAAVLAINDNGVGVQHPMSKLGMGQDLMRALARQLNGELNIVDGPEGGRQVHVRFCLGLNAAA